MQPLETAHVLYPPINPYASELLDVGDGHRLYVEQCGNASGIPMVYLHGGPGSGCSPRHRQFFDPTRCRVVLFDQRGCGRSLPHGSAQRNDTDALVHDMEVLRIHLGIARWLVVGGSWGAGLALAYAEAHPQACLGLVLRGVFLGRDLDVDWFFRGAAALHPDAWRQLADPAPAAARGNLLQWLHSNLHGTDAHTALSCALAWEAWEQTLVQQRTVAARTLAPDDALATVLTGKYRIQSHYLVHRCFRHGAGLLQQAHHMAGLPVAVLHGRLDGVCRAEAAWHVHRALGGSRLRWVEGCGHNPFEPGNALALAEAIAHFVTYGHFAEWGEPVKP